ncbi:DUF6946 family protein [Aequorivita sinensis]|uniref:DUF6946 family protein n=1 Tax=Aequorivita sinensis TaxID=1382458 RepID=UPI00111D370D|nr:hypothetical protein [Aequorivita sinensis]
MIISGEIKNIDEWYIKAGPKNRKTQWAVNHSALEFAKLVLDISFENDIKQNILDKISANQKIILAIPEQISKLDDYIGGQRNHDLALFTRNESEKIAVCFEAKVNEDLGVKLSRQWEEGYKKNSNIHNRIKTIIDCLWQNSRIENYNELKYQLLTGLFGTIKFAEKLEIKKCVFCIYQIQIDEKTKVTKTEKEIQKLVDCFNVNDKVENNKLFGPFKTISNIEFYISYLKREKIED